MNAGNCCVEATHLVDVTVRILLNGHESNVFLLLWNGHEWHP